MIVLTLKLEPASATEVIEGPTAGGPGWELQAVELTVSWYCSIMEQLPWSNYQSSMGSGGGKLSTPVNNAQQLLPLRYSE